MSGFAENLRQIRDARGLTQSELADRMGVAQAFISQLETGRRRPSPALIGRIATALDVDAAVLTKGEEVSEVKANELFRKLKGLSPDALDEVEDYLKYLQHKRRGE